MKKKTAELISWDAHLDKKYGKPGTIKRTAFEANAQAFIIGELIKIERERAHLTQEQMAEKTGTKKSYISRVENGKADIQLSTLYKLVEQGLNKKLELVIR
ncbi:MAG TPA: transcriptional regulator [Chitinophagaceae bacterium]|jgi:ribosome-binding protein aMBF1 (putative translation factor)|nr:transcriptional regulator [Chitinophagaceae bacterium]